MRQSSPTMRVLVLLGTLTIAACSSSAELGGIGNNNAGGLGGRKKSKDHVEADDGTTQAKSPDDPERPSDSSEGLSGYLVDPGMVSIGVRGTPSNLEVSGAAGAIAATDFSQVVVSVWSIKDTDLGAGTAADAGAASIKGKHLGDISPNATDGSFAGSFPVDPDGERYAISVRGRSTDGNFTVEPAADGRYTAMTWAPGEGEHPIPLAAIGGGAVANETQAPSGTGGDDGTGTGTKLGAASGTIPAGLEGRTGGPYPAWGANTLPSTGVRISNFADGATVPYAQLVSVEIEVDPDVHYTSLRLVVTDERAYSQWLTVSADGANGVPYARFVPIGGATGATRTLEVAVYDQLALPVGRSAPITVHVSQ